MAIENQETNISPTVGHASRRKPQYKLIKHFLLKHFTNNENS